MFAVIFEVVPKQELWNEYLDLAKLLKRHAASPACFDRKVS